MKRNSKPWIKNCRDFRQLKKNMRGCLKISLNMKSNWRNYNRMWWKWKKQRYWLYFPLKYYVEDACVIWDRKKLLWFFSYSIRGNPVLQMMHFLWAIRHCFLIVIIIKAFLKNSWKSCGQKDFSDFDEYFSS